MWEQTDSSPYKNNRIYVRSWKIAYDYTDDWKTAIETNSTYIWLHHIVITREDKICNIYVDNKLDNSWTFEDAYNDTQKFEIWDNYNGWSNTRFFNWDIWLLRIYHRIFTKQEIKALYYEWLRKLWQWILQQYPELFKWCVLYHDFKNWELSNIINWALATNNWATLTTDHLWIVNNAYSFDWSSNNIDLWTYLNNYNKNLSVHVITKVWWDWTIFIKWHDNSDNDWRWFYISIISGNLHIWVVTTSDWTKWYDFDTWFTPTNWIYYNIIVTHDNDNSVLNVYVDWNNVYNTNNYWSDLRAVNSSLLWEWNKSSNYYTWNISYLSVYNYNMSTNKAKQLYILTKKKYIYPNSKYTPANLPKQLLFINWNRNWNTFYDISWNGNDWTQSWWVTNWRIWQIN